MSHATVLQLNELACMRGERLLFDGVNATVRAGELLQITGSNGSGKTSLLRLLLGFLKPFSGVIHWQEVSSILHIGHHNAVKHELTVLENWYYQFLISRDRVNDIDDVLHQLGLHAYANTICRHLSQGQKQKVALARLWLLPASVWVLDEPFTALDNATIDLLEQFFLKKLQAGVAIILTTHRPFGLRALDAHIKKLDLSC
jgi:heme exporter protein A